MAEIKDLNQEQTIDWVLNYVEGAGIPSTVHYNGIQGNEDVDEWAVPLSLIPTLRREMKAVIKDG